MLGSSFGYSDFRPGLDGGLNGGLSGDGISSPGRDQRNTSSPKKPEFAQFAVPTTGFLVAQHRNKARLPKPEHNSNNLVTASKARELGVAKEL